MNTPKSSATEQEVIQLYLYGTTTQKIAKKCGTSIGYVSGVITRLKEKLGQREVSAIREFTVAMRKLGISAPQALVGAKIYSVIGKSELDEDKLGELILDTIEKSQTQGISLSKLIECSKIISALQEKSNISLEDLPMTCQEMLEEKETLEKDIAILSQQKASAETQATSALEEKDLTVQKIKEFDTVKTQLEKNDIGVNDLQKLVAILKKASDVNYNSGKIINHLQKEESYESQVEKLVQEQKRLQSTVDNQTKKLESITKEIEEKKSVANIIRNLNKIGIKEQGLQSLYHVVMSIAKNHNINAKAALQRLHEDLKNNYDKKLGLKIHLEKLENDISAKSKELQSVQIKEKDFKAKHEDNLNTLKILKKLKQQGIEHTIILKWHKILESSKLDVGDFSKKIKKIGDLAKIITTLEQKSLKLQKQIEKLESRKKWLEENIDGLDSKFHHVDQILKRSLDDFLSDVQKKISTASKYATNTIDETGKKTRESLEAHHRETSDSLREMISELDQWVAKSIKESKKIGKSEWILTFYEFLLGDSFVASRDIPMAINILERLNYCIQKHNLNSTFFESHIKQLRVDLEKMIAEND